MPVHIKELVIRSRISGQPSDPRSLDANEMEKLKAQIVRECADKVHQMMKSKMER